MSEHKDCSICLEESKAPFTTECKHIFCKECLDSWRAISNTCPYCRTNLPEFNKPERLPSLADIETMIQRIRNPEIFNRMVKNIIVCHPKEFDVNKVIDRDRSNKNYILEKSEI